MGAEAQSASTSGTASTKWSYSAMQAIPRNAEALWSLIDTVYFATIPQGHEILECLNAILQEPAVAPASMTVDSAPTVRFSYKLGNEREVGAAPPTPFSCHVDVAMCDGFPSILYSDTLMPVVTPPSRRLASRQKPEATPAGTPPVASWTLCDAISDSPMEGEVSESVSELSFLKSELARVRSDRNALLTSILARVESEVRPNKKSWFEAEQNLLALFEKKPPSSFQTSNGGEAKELPLSALGKVDASLPDSCKDAELCCSICGEGDTTDDNDILICDGCSFAAHQSCYFVHDIPEGSWFCQLCDSFFKSAGGGKKASRRLDEGSGLDTLLDATHCTLCLQSASFVGGGLMKPATNGWAHVKCAVWVPEAAFPPDGLSITVIANKDRENLRCTLCKQKGGCPLQCAFGRCTAAFHAACAAQAGLLPEEKSLKNLYCVRHVKIQLKTSPSVSRLLSLRKQDAYLKAMSDKYVAPKIGGSLFTPGFDPLVDAQQAYLLQFAGVHPTILQELEGGYINPSDLMDPDQSVPLLKERLDIVSFAHFGLGGGGKDGVSTEPGNTTFVDLSVCCECMRPVNDTRELVVKCECCNLLAHAICYDRCGVPAANVDDLGSSALARVVKYDSKKWGPKSTGTITITCVRCAHVGVKMIDTHCVLCMQLGGVVVPVADDEDDAETGGGEFGAMFAHPRCLWWLLATSLTSLLASPAPTVKSISSNYHFHPCSVCGSRLGCTVRCARVGCTKRFHVSCGFHAGAFFSVRTTAGVVAGSRDGEDDDVAIENLTDAIGGTPMRRIVTCWQHEQRGMRRSAPQLGRVKPVRSELVRWVPEGIRADLVNAVNQVLSGQAVEAKPDDKEKRKYSRKVKEEDDAEDDASRIKRKRGRPKLETVLPKGEKVQTVRFVDGMEVTCEDEDWEGGCSMCGKAWTDAKGQVLESICCDRCDQWYHFSCVGIEKPPSGDFICPPCLTRES